MKKSIATALLLPSLAVSQELAQFVSGQSQITGLRGILQIRNLLSVLGVAPKITIFGKMGRNCLIGLLTLTMDRKNVSGHFTMFSK